MSKRAGEMDAADMERIVTIMQNPREYKIPDWFLNRQKDCKDGKYSQLLSNALDNKYREDMERLRRFVLIAVFVLLYLKVRGQHTKTTGRGGRTMGVAAKEINELRY